MIKRQRWVIAAIGTLIAAAGGAGIHSVTSRDPDVTINPSLYQALGSDPLPSTPGAKPAPSPTPTVATTTAGPSQGAAKPSRPKKKASQETTAKTGAGSGSVQGTGPITFGTTYTGNGTFYAATGAGNCSFDASSDRMIGAMNKRDYANSAACGDFLAVTGPSGKTITIKVVDQCPECKPGDIDLSAEAFATLATPSTGRIRISWHLLSPTLSGPVSYVYKTGSSKFWCGVQVRNHRNPVRSLELNVNGRWKSLPRADYNYFLSEDGSGCGGTIRITDIFGHRLTDSGIAISPNAVQRGRAQFGSAG